MCCIIKKTPTSSYFLWITCILAKYWYDFNIITVRKTIARTVLDLEEKIQLLKSKSGADSFLN